MFIRQSFTSFKQRSQKLMKSQDGQSFWKRSDLEMALPPVLVRLLITYGLIGITTKAVWGAEFKFLSELPKYKVINTGEETDFNCTTNDATAVSSLWMKLDGGAWKERKLEARKIVKKGNVFTLLNADTNDARQHKCKAENQAGDVIWTRQKNPTYLFVHREYVHYTHWPTQPQFRRVGQSVSFSLNATILSKITWKRMNEKDRSTWPIDAVHNVTVIQSSGVSSKVTLYNLKRTDTGAYIAIGKYKDREDFAYFRLQVFGPTKPKIYEISPDSVINELSTKHLQCNVSAYPPANIVWYKNGRRVPVCDVYKRKCRKARYWYESDSKSNWTVAKLTIRSVKYQDDGMYLCRANNSEGEKRSTTRLTVRTKPSIKQGNTIMNFASGKIAIVECEVTRSYPPPTFKWFYQISPCVPGGQCGPRPNKWLDLSSSVTIDEPQNSKEKSRLILPSEEPRVPTFYKCEAENVRGRDSFYYEVFRYKQDNSMKLLGVSKGKSQVANAEESLTLQCYLRLGVLNPRNLGWYKDGLEIAVLNNSRFGVIRTDENSSTVLGDVKQKKITLNIRNLTKEDSGKYACKASEDMNKTVEVTVKAIKRPKLLWQSNGIQSMTVYENVTSVQLRCKLKEGNPKPKFSWLKDNKPLIPNGNQLNSADCKHARDGIYYFTAGSKQDVILCGDPLRYEDFAGRYTCRAENKLGADEIHADLNILAIADIEEPMEDNSQLFVFLEETVQQTCQARGNPPPIVEWRKIQGNSSILVNNRSENGRVELFFESFTMEDEGNYSCVARNSHSIQRHFVQLNLEPGVLASEAKLKSNGAVVGAATACVLVVLVIAFITLFAWQRQKKRYYLGSERRHYDIDPDRTILEQVNDMPYDPDWEFREDRLLLGKVLGSGAFGQVVQAEAMGILAFSARDKTDLAFKRRSKIRRSIKARQVEQKSDNWKFAKTTVAVKMLKEDSGEIEYRDLASEIKIMIHIGEHPNIINILGACTRSKRLMLIMEYAPHGSLLKFLREKRSIYEPTWKKTINDPNEEFTLVDELMAAYQIARGMEFLSSKKCIHRDLAARNVLIGDGYVMKIADFGLARDVYKNDEYVKQTSGLLPVKWMALESLFDRVYTEKSDVWSFGVVLWEIFTLGGSPYPGLPTEHLLDFLSENKRMAQPHDCPPKVYNMMRDCWILQPECRPTFAVLAEQLGKFLEKNIRKDNPYISLALDETATGNQYYLLPKDGCRPPTRLSQAGNSEGAGPSHFNSIEREKKQKYVSDPSIMEYPGEALDGIVVETSHLQPDLPPSYDEALKRSNEALQNIAQGVSETEEDMCAAAAWVGYHRSSSSADEGIGLEEEALEKRRLLSSSDVKYQNVCKNDGEEMTVLLTPTQTSGPRRGRIESVV